MDRLHVNSEFTAMVGDDLDPDAATTSLESFRETGPEVGLVNNRKGLLDIASLGHCNNCRRTLVDCNVGEDRETYQCHLANQEHGIA